MSKRDDFQTSMEENLALWGARLSTIRAKLSTETPAEGRAADQEKLAVWAARHDAAVAKLEELKTTSGDAWDVRKHEMAKMWHELDTLMALAEQAVRAHDDTASNAGSTPPVASIETHPIQ